MNLTEEQILSAATRALTKADEWGDTSPKFRQIWNGTVAEVTIDGKVRRFENLGHKINLAEVCESGMYYDIETGLNFDIEAWGGS